MNKKVFMKYITAAVLLGILITSVHSCKKYYDPPLVFQNADSIPFTKAHKVLLIVMEGGAADAIKEIAPKNIMALTENAKYTWSAYGDANTKDGPSMTNLISGRGASSFSIIDSSFVPAFEEDEEGNPDHDVDIPVYSNMYIRMLQAGAEINTVAVTPWAELSQAGLTYVGKNILVNNDEQVKDSAVQVLGAADPDYLLVDFNSANIAGNAGAFNASDAGYKSAVNKIDGYIGELVDAVKSRPDYDLEDWLIIITSNHGADENGYGGATLSQRKIFTIYHNQNLNKQELIASPIYNTFELSSKSNVAALSPEKSTQFNFGTSGEYTILTKVMMMSKPGGSSHGVLAANSSSAYGTVYGWNFMITGSGSGSSYRYVLGYGSSSLTFIGGGSNEASGPLNTWETVALKIYNSSGKRFAVMYVNGKKGDSTEIPQERNYSGRSGTDYLMLGVNSNSIGVSKYALQDFSFWNKALSDEEIMNYECNSEITSTYGSYNSLLGYWHCNDAQGKTIKGTSAKGDELNLNMSTVPNWLTVEGINCLDEKTFFVSNSDIAPNIFYWLNVQTSSDWNWASTQWLSDFESEFYGK